MKIPFLILLFLAAPVLFCQEATVTRYPLLVRGELPTYPVLARTAKVSGNVQIQVRVREGQVVETQTISGNPLFLPSTMENIKTWKFNKDVSVTFMTTFIYLLEEEETAMPSNPKLELELPAKAIITARPSKQPCHDCGANPLGKAID